MGLSATPFAITSMAVHQINLHCILAQIRKYDQNYIKYRFTCNLVYTVPNRHLKINTKPMHITIQNFGNNLIFLLRQSLLNWSKGTLKTFMLQKISISNMLLFWI